ncbi:MAG: sterol desaturase family protein [Bacteroidota bacterium]
MEEVYKNGSVIILFSFVLLMTVAEMYFSYRHDRKHYEKRDTLNNFYLMTFAFVINLLTKAGTFILLHYVYLNYRFFEIQNAILYWFILLVAQDFLYWILHYTGHYVRLFWAMHVTHHSSSLFNLTTGFRSTVFEPLYRVFFYLPLALIGFDAFDILFIYLITQIYGNIVHTQLVKKFHPVIEYLFVTPSHHRVHHASNLIYLDKNMGMVLIIWDRMFGTFQEELEGEKIKYGLTKQPTDQGPVNIVFHEFIALSKDIKKVPSYVDKLKYIFYPPGWSHDGSTQTAKVMQNINSGISNSDLA